MDSSLSTEDEIREVFLSFSQSHSLYSNTNVHYYVCVDFLLSLVDHPNLRLVASVIYNMYCPYTGIISDGIQPITKGGLLGEYATLYDDFSLKVAYALKRVSDHETEIHFASAAGYYEYRGIRGMERIDSLWFDDV